MNTKEIYDALINEIETKAKDKNLDANDILHGVLQACGYEKREFDACMRFMTGITLLEYIKSRKFMAAYEHLLSTPRKNNPKKPDIQGAVDISGYDQSKFTNKFSKIFNMTPTEAFKEKDESLFVPPKTWNVISGEERIVKTVEKAEDVTESISKFGIPKSQYDKIIEAYELEELYNFSPMYSAVAFEVAEKLNITLKEAFEFADSIKDYGGEFDDYDPEEDEERIDPEIKLREIAFDPYAHFVFFTCHLSIDTGYFFLWERDWPKEEIMKLNPNLFRLYATMVTEEMAGSYLSFWTFEEAYDCYTERATDEYTDDDFYEFVGSLEKYESVEEAFNNLIPDSTWNDLDDYDFYVDENEILDYGTDSIEKMADEIESWNDVDIDDHWDEENPYYQYD